jgi:hypothetical protein
MRAAIVALLALTACGQAFTAAPNTQEVGVMSEGGQGETGSTTTDPPAHDSGVASNDAMTISTQESGAGDSSVPTSKDASDPTDASDSDSSDLGDASACEAACVAGWAPCYDACRYDAGEDNSLCTVTCDNLEATCKAACL